MLYGVLRRRVGRRNFTSSGVVQNLPILGDNRRAETAGPRAGSRCVLFGRWPTLPELSSQGLWKSQAQQSEPVRMALSRHQFARAFAVTLGAPTAHEAPMVQEELQQT